MPIILVYFFHPDRDNYHLELDTLSTIPQAVCLHRLQGEELILGTQVNLELRQCTPHIQDMRLRSILIHLDMHHLWIQIRQDMPHQQIQLIPVILNSHIALLKGQEEVVSLCKDNTDLSIIFIYSKIIVYV